MINIIINFGSPYYRNHLRAVLPSISFPLIYYSDESRNIWDGKKVSKYSMVTNDFWRRLYEQNHSESTVTKLNLGQPNNPFNFGCVLMAQA